MSFAYLLTTICETFVKRTFFYLDEEGELARNEAIQPSWWIRFPSRLHIVYLLLDVGQRLPFVAGKIFSNLEEKIFRKALKSGT